MSDGRINNGGKRPGQGRPRKADEEKVRRLGINAIIEVYGSVEQYYIFIAKQAKESFPHLRLLQEYVYGKPKETLLIEDDKQPDIDLSNLTDEELDVLSKLYGRKSIDTDNSTD